MPLYEYQCKQCNRRTEKIQKYSDPEITTCPHCGGVLERTLTAPAVHFAGGGWYKDGYASAKPPATPAAEGGSGSATAPASSDSSGSTPAPATAAPATAAPAAPSTPAPAKS